MAFQVSPKITTYPDLQAFLDQYKLGADDLLVTNEFVITPQMDVTTLPCDVLYIEKYGTGEPTDEMIDALIGTLAGKNYKRIIGIGGGSVLDVSKLLIFGGDVTWASIAETEAGHPRKSYLILVPTTCGTGSEVTCIAVANLAKEKTKKGLAYPGLFADEAVLIPSLLATLPYEVFAASSIDALIHAMESYVSPKANHFSRAIGRKAIELILHGYIAMVDSGKLEQPKDMKDFAEASTMGGIAFANAGCAAVHALSFPLGGIYKVPHGKSNWMMFPQVFAQYQKKGADLSPLEDVLMDIFGCPREAVWETMFKLLDQILPCPPLRELGITEAECASMAKSVIEVQQRLLVNNPVPFTEEDVKEIYIRSL